jgi:hypothetical protein
MANGLEHGSIIDDVEDEGWYLVDESDQAILDIERRSDIEIVRIEIVRSLRELMEGDGPTTVLGVLANRPRTLPEIAARIERLPEEVSLTLGALQRVGIVAEGKGEGRPSYYLHPNPQQ